MYYLKKNQWLPQWTQDMEKDLIEAVKLRPHLWDPTCKLIHLKHNLYHEISREMIAKYPSHLEILTSSAVWRKFKNFRTYYKRELVKIKRAKPGYQTTWIHFDRLSFLSDPANFLSIVSSTDNQAEDVDHKNNYSNETDELKQQQQLDVDHENDFSDETGQSEVYKPLIKHKKPKTKSLKRKAKDLSNEAEIMSEDLKSIRVIEEKNLGLYLAARIYSIKNRSKRNSLTVEILNLINSYDNEDDSNETNMCTFPIL